MPVYALGERTPQIHPEAFVHPEAVIIGSVTVGRLASVWPNAVLRGDSGSIAVGERSSIQDGCVVHTTDELVTSIGSDCVIGHLVHLEGCTIEPGCLVGNGAIVLHRAVVRTGAIVAANAVVLDDTDVPSGAIALGTPAAVKPGRARPELISDGVAEYLARVERYHAGLRRIG